MRIFQGDGPEIAVENRGKLSFQHPRLYHEMSPAPSNRGFVPTLPYCEIYRIDQTHYPEMRFRESPDRFDKEGVNCSKNLELTGSVGN